MQLLEILFGVWKEIIISFQPLVLSQRAVDLQDELLDVEGR